MTIQIVIYLCVSHLKSIQTTLNNPQSEGDSASNETDAETRPRNLSVVRPEILFGGKFPGSDEGFPIPAMQFGPSLAAIAAAAFAGERQQSVKEIFQEALKLYGVPAELAETLAKNVSNSTPGKKPSYL